MYKPFAQRVPDLQYRMLLKRLLESGIRVPSRQGADALMLWGVQMHFDMRNGFPMLMERNLAPASAVHPQWQQAIGEICGFINGARTQEQLEKFGCHWWHLWVTSEKCADFGLFPGDLGSGSYGAAFHDYPTQTHQRGRMGQGFEGFNQYAHLLEQMRDFPGDRTHIIDPWVPYHTLQSKRRKRQVVVAPCHGWQHYRIIGNELYLHMWQRSGDLILGVPNNTIQYAALGMMVAQVLGLRFRAFVHTISDCHFYLQTPENTPGCKVSTEDVVRAMLVREPRAYPTVSIDSTVTDLFAFRTEHFTLTDYHPHPGIKSIPAAI